MSYKRWVLVSIAIFGAGLVLGLFAPSGIADIVSDEIDFLKELGDIYAPFSFATFMFIFGKNAAAVLISFVLSPILCITPFLSLAVNGLVLSFVSSAVIEEQSLGYLFAGILPHGVLELPALIIAQAAALSFGTAAMLALVKKERRKLLLPNLKTNLRYLLISLALLLPAAIVETYVTPLFLQ